MQIRVSNNIVLIDDEDLYLIARYKWRIFNGYVVSSQGIRIHRLILGIHTEKYNYNKQVDHINRNKLDNRKCNLRICTAQQNSSNKTNDYVKYKTSIYKGVQKSRNKWRASVKYYGEKKHAGQFDTELEAALAYNKRAIELHGEFAVINEFTDCYTTPDP